MEEITSIDIKNVCRTCLSASNDLENLFTAFFNEETISSILNYVLIGKKVEIDEDERITSYICQSCKIAAINAYKFQLMCIDSDRNLRILIDNSVVEEEVKLEHTEQILTNQNPDIIANQHSSDDVGEIEFLIESDDSHDSEYNSDAATEDANEYNCDLCSKPFNSPSSLKLHMTNDHEIGENEKKEENDEEEECDDKKEFPCPDCSKIFKKSSLLASII
jgi:Zinc-finger associated domain (zf-AD)/Zinc finger, C2H2 type